MDRQSTTTRTIQNSVAKDRIIITSLNQKPTTVPQLFYNFMACKINYLNIAILQASVSVLKAIICFILSVIGRMSSFNIIGNKTRKRWFSWTSKRHGTISIDRARIHVFTVCTVRRHPKNKATSIGDDSIFCMHLLPVLLYHRKW